MLSLPDALVSGWPDGTKPGEEIVERERDRKARIGLGNGLTGLRECQHPRAPRLTSPAQQQCEAGVFPSQHVDDDRSVHTDRIRDAAISTHVNSVPFLLKTLTDRPGERVVVLDEQHPDRAGGSPRPFVLGESIMQKG